MVTRIGLLLFVLLVSSAAGAEPFAYRYRLTITLMVDGQHHTGSTVVEVTWRNNPTLGHPGAVRGDVRGQAALVDLGHRGIIFAALNNGESYDSYGAVNLRHLGARAFGNYSSEHELYELPKLSGRRELSFIGLPLLIWLSNPDDRGTARQVLPTQFPRLFGESARVESASVEITQDPIVFDLHQKLPWLAEFVRAGDSPYRISSFVLQPSMLVQD